jgi:hypothetical protein
MFGTGRYDGIKLKMTAKLERIASYAEASILGRSGCFVNVRELRTENEANPP